MRRLPAALFLVGIVLAGSLWGQRLGELFGMGGVGLFLGSLVFLFVGIQVLKRLET